MVRTPFNLIFQRLARGSSGCLRHPPHPPYRMRTVLPAFALAAVLVMMLAVTVWGWGAAAPHAEESWQAAIPDTQPYLPTDGVRQVLDMAASALLPGYAFAQTSDTTPPTFVSSALDIDTGVLTITFSETIDAASIVPAKMHIRESGNYTHGVTLSAGELVTVADGATISFTLTLSHLAAVAGLATPELTIEPGGGAERVRQPHSRHL